MQCWHVTDSIISFIWYMLKMTVYFTLGSRSGNWWDLSILPDEFDQAIIFLCYECTECGLFGRAYWQDWWKQWLWRLKLWEIGLCEDRRERARQKGSTKCDFWPRRVTHILRDYFNDKSVETRMNDFKFIMYLLKIYMFYTAPPYLREACLLRWVGHS